MMLTMQQTATTAAAGAAATYFVFYHLCVSLVVLSLFVAVILGEVLGCFSIPVKGAIALGKKS